MVFIHRRKRELEQLTKRREQLRSLLQEHFSRTPVERDYAEFDRVVDELEDVRQRLFRIKNA
ncbi:MAG: hypothetical protein ACM3L6_06575 [Deltaproteobacteria bacterium]